MQHVIIARPTIGHPLFMHWLDGDAADAAAAAATIAAVESRPVEVHRLANDRIERVTRHHPDGSITVPALFRDGGLISAITL
jgi:hypothetical protein